METTTLPQMILDYAKIQAEALFAADETRVCSYGQAAELMLRCAAALSREGVSKNQMVLVHCSQDISYLLAGVGAQLCGAVFVPVEKKATPARIGEIAREVDSSLIISDSLTEGQLPSVRILSYSSLFEQEAGDYVPESLSAEDTAEILFTTGTTGASKGIEITHKNNIALAQNICQGLQMEKGNVEWLPLMLSHSHALRCCYSNFYLGCGVLITNGVSRLLQVFEMMKTHHVTAMDLSPAAATVLLKLAKGKFPFEEKQLSYVQIGTAALPEALKKELVDTFPNTRLYNFYGSTESGRSCVLNFNSADDHPFCIGRACVNAKFFVLDSDDRPFQSSPQHTGLLATAGPMNMKGYFGQEEMTAEVMKDGLFHSNDEGYMDADGLIYVLGRADDIINFKGIKIAPEEIEEKASSFPGITDCCCIGIRDDAAGQIPVLFYSGQPRPDEKALRDHLSQLLDPARMPKRLIPIAEIPRTANGKLLRRKLREIAL